jgi:hypothetical protein
MEAKIAEFVDEELKPAFGYLIEFVLRAELEKAVDTLDAGMSNEVFVIFSFIM